VSKSICMVYHSEKQIVTKTHPSHSGLVFAVAKISKIIGIPPPRKKKNTKKTAFFICD